jgi:hypothetical protein
VLRLSLNEAGAECGVNPQAGNWKLETESRKLKAES